MRHTLAVILVALAVVLAGCSIGGNGDGNGDVGNGNGDFGNGDGNAVGNGAGNGDGSVGSQDVVTEVQAPAGGAGGNGNGAGGYDAAAPEATAAPSNAASRSADQAEIGLSVGGAQDATAFRNNVKEGYVPQPTDLTYEGLYHDYYFDTDQDRPCDALFCPSFSRAVTNDPLSDEREQYMTVGLNSGLTQADFQRKDLNLVVVLDVSGSMDERFDEYHYDEDDGSEPDRSVTKIEAAKDSVLTVFSHLDDRDRLGVVTFNNGANTVQRLQSVDDMDREALSQKVQRLDANGGTNLDAGMRRATEMLRPYRDANGSESETRIIYVTDAMPNTGQIESGQLGDRFRENAQNGVYTTFLGVGVDFNSRLVQQITNVRGANYYSVNSPQAFADRMDEGFQYMVTPLVFDLSLEISEGAEAIERVYGSSEQAYVDGKIIDIATLFPSRSSGNKSEGGVVLLELDETQTETITLETSYEDRAGQRHNTTRTIDLDSREAPYYGSTGIRKAVALTRYGTLMQNWAAYERASQSGSSMDVDEGIEPREDRSQWEQQSVPLRVTPPYDERIQRFESYFQSEAEALGSDRFQQDLAILETLTENATVSESTTEAVGSGEWAAPGD